MMQENEVILKCAICQKQFTSRNQLFVHINATGHAQLKSDAPPAAAGNKSNKKKR